MSNRTPLVWGIVLVALGLAGIVSVWVSSSGSGASNVNGTFSSTGQLIYFTGADASGPIPRTVGGSGFTGFGMMGDMACVDCHGQDGRGGRVGMMFGSIDIPDIRYSILTSARSQDGTTVPAWTDSDIARAIHDGVEPSGQPLNAPMPRWEMTDAEVNDVISYLKELSAR